MNAKHQFKYTYNETDLEEYSPLEVTFEVPATATITQMLNNFEQYLKACGYVFDGRLDIVEDSFDDAIWPSDSDGWCDGEYTVTDCVGKQFIIKETGCDCPTGPKGVKGECGLDATSSPLEFGRDKKVKEWNEGLAKLEKDLREQRDIREKAYKSAEMCAEVAKNKWVHGICNPPSPDWKVQNK